MIKTESVAQRGNGQVYISAQQFIGEAVVGRGPWLRIYEGVSLASYQRLAQLVELAGARVAPGGLGWTATIEWRKGELS